MGSQAYIVRKEYSGLEKFTLDLPNGFDGRGLTIKDNRNVIKKIATNYGSVVVKDFRGMYFFNRLAYSLFRKSKAERSFINSGILNDRGIITPPHVSWLNCYQGGLLTRSYFVSIDYPYNTLEQYLASEVDESNRSILIHDLVVFTKTLHSRDIYHKDFSVGNILVIPKDEGFQFALVDLNRVRFRKVAFNYGIRNFTTLALPPDLMNAFIEAYAKLSNESPQAAIKMFWNYKNRASAFRKIRKTIRRYTITPLEKLVSAIRNSLRGGNDYNRATIKKE